MTIFFFISVCSTNAMTTKNLSVLNQKEYFKAVIVLRQGVWACGKGKGRDENEADFQKIMWVECEAMKG